jgi:hypothetical protein
MVIKRADRISSGMEGGYWDAVNLALGKREGNHRRQMRR